MRMGRTMQAYGEPSYWDERYSHESGPFDWYQKYNALAPLLHLYIPLHHRVLVVGCGNSAFSEGMVNDGYKEVVNIDISSVVIQAMQRKYSDRPQLKYIRMDVLDMSGFQTGSFDAVVDKGTLDSLLCGNNSRQLAVKMLKEVERVLKNKGVYMLITYGAPIYRLRLLRDSCSWTIKLHVIEKFMLEAKTEHQTWELTNPVPLDDEGSSVEAVLGKNPDVHYIYICIKAQKPLGMPMLNPTCLSDVAEYQSLALLQSELFWSLFLFHTLYLGLGKITLNGDSNGAVPRIPDTDTDLISFMLVMTSTFISGLI
ncbi:Methyltransferase-like protein 13 [Vitis vinifera]|uniref:Methyltransferase-like protein 13 n=1 Tax=Vitis vinifera TaxID=29760 RepID=A0A438KM01_VITVI|nr:Methyltransferase-like protein 13 [Vitis vinifera]